MIRSKLAKLALSGMFAVAALTAGDKPINTDYFDKDCKPCDDFYKYANGAWLKTAEIPAEESNYGMFQVVRNRNQDLLKQIVQKAGDAKGALPGSPRQLVGDFYASGMDQKTIDAAGIKPLASYLAEINGFKNASDIGAFVSASHRGGLDFLFGFTSLPDFSDSSMEIAYCVQGGLGLPDRDYYLKEDAESAELRKKYRAHIAEMLRFLDYSAADAGKAAGIIMEMETALAQASLSAVERRDPATWYNLKTQAEADAATPNFSWSNYFKTLALSEVKQFSFAHPKFFAEMDNMLAKRPVSDWQHYLRWHLISGAAPFLSAEIRAADFAFSSTTLRGVEEQQPRWKQVINATNSVLGEALGQMYVAEAFPPEAKQRMMVMIDDLRVALKNRLKNLAWMSEETKKKALIKADSFTPHIGYPDEWRDYSQLKIKRGDYAGNLLRGRAHARAYEIHKVGKPVNPKEWGMNPQVVNAYYNPLKNEIVFPAGILQPPFFNMSADDAVNYGAIGAVIGHELMHGFDDAGSRFDHDGNMKNWWTEDDREKFDARAAELVAQFNGYEPLEGLFVNGELTLGENIADLGGLTISYEALQSRLAKTGNTAKIDGFTPSQRFFLSWAQAWRRLYRDEELTVRVKTDPHSPSQYRANGPVSNMPTFYKAFGCKQGDAMFRDEKDRVVIW
ncbi:M13 family metallopeptidase [Acanthopleuribacter pedis]|uniref:M13 family metallopeptidase n=1 Tax=Acanthopleuribacter pedis TaxID=442870 RepID=A0A8J7U5X4_9BACT|nr:M13 family metallopeptidase [Acanthopleuribacter pedis]MBO1322172.1 M13 family metallopeptidase [Acanthopleuribacter pedis]